MKKKRATERFLDLLKATPIWLISKLELEQAYILGLSFPIHQMGVIKVTSQSSWVEGESKELIYEKVKLLAHNVVLRPVTSASPGNLLIRQNPGPHLRSPESETLGGPV